MNNPTDPPRLFDAASDTTDGVRAVLRSGQRGLPGPGDLARLVSRLPLGPLPPPSGPRSLQLVPPRLVAPLAAPSVLPGALLGMILGLGVVGGMWWRDAAAPTPPVAPAQSAGTIERAPSVEARPSQRRVDVPAPVPAREAASSPSSSATARAAPTPEVSADSLQNEAPRAASGDAEPSGAVLPQAGTPLGDETEVHLLQRAHNALGADPSAALALTVEHTRRFAGGSLAQEREFIAVSALLALGRTPEARGRADSLLARFPSSPYRGRLESLGLGNSFQKNEAGSPRTQ